MSSVRVSLTEIPRSLHSSIDLGETFDVPTFHVVFLLSLPTTIIPRKYPSASLIPTIKTLREELIQWVADEALAGDTIAAEWIILSIFSRVWVSPVALQR